VRDQVRRGKFDDTPNATGTKVMMDDDQFQCAKCHIRPVLARTFLNLGFPLGVILLTQHRFPVRIPARCERPSLKKGTLYV
jgi:hypothetical protein